jgi:plasmid stabilization system protein ParE
VSGSRYVVRPKADQDLDDQAYYYATTASPEVGYRFLIAAHSTLALLATQPDMGWHARLRHGDLKGLRVFRVTDFERILVLYLSRRFDPRTGADGCDFDEASAYRLRRQFGWIDREQEFRDQSAALVDRHWAEIVAVATELLRARELDETEVEIIADIAVGEATPEDLARYRSLGRSPA